MKPFVMSAQVAVDATAGNASVGLWNSSSIPVLIKKIKGTIFVQTANEERPSVRRTSARGTQGTTVAFSQYNLLTVDTTTAFSGLNIDSNYSVEPTKRTGDLGDAMVPGTGGNVDIYEVEFDFENDPLWIPSANGICINDAGSNGISHGAWTFYGCI